MSSRKKREDPARRQAEMDAARLLGRHVSKEKGRALLAAALAACAMPMVLGVRLWEEIPEIVPTGLTGPGGQDDSLPRAVVVFGLPGLMCVLNLITHVQLLVSQKRMTLPRVHIRLMGRWGFPILSVVFCSGMILESAGRGLTPSFLTPCLLGLGLMLLGSRLWDCPRDARLSLQFVFPREAETGPAWDRVHRFAGGLWLAAGLLAIAWAMAADSAVWSAVPLLAAVLIAPAAGGRLALRE